MRVIEITEPGGPETLRIGNRDEPVPGGGELVVRVLYSGVNRADLLQRRGRYPTPRGFPSDVPGLEYSGIVESTGNGCYLRAPGDRVMGILGGGGYAERVAVSERETVAIPEGMPMDQAGGVPEAFMTAWDALFEQAGLGSGEVVLVHAVGSGVGTAAVQLAQVAGAFTVGTSRTPDKLDRARHLGLDVAVLAGEDRDWSSEVLERLDGRKVDVILDLVGADYLDGNTQVLATRARWMVVGVPSGSSGVVDLRGLMSRRSSLTGTVLRARPWEEKVTLARDFERRVVPHFASGRIHPVLDRVFPAEEAPAAHRYLEENRTFGTVVLAWNPSN